MMVTRPAVDVAGVTAVRLVLLTKVTPVPAALPKVTVAPDTKFIPLSVTRVPPVTGPEVGDTEYTTGGGLVAAAIRAVPKMTARTRSSRFVIIEDETEYCDTKRDVDEGRTDHLHE